MKTLIVFCISVAEWRAAPRLKDTRSSDTIENVFSGMASTPRNSGQGYRSRRGHTGPGRVYALIAIDG